MTKWQITGRLILLTAFSVSIAFAFHSVAAGFVAFTGVNVAALHQTILGVKSTPEV